MGQPTLNGIIIPPDPQSPVNYTVGSPDDTATYGAWLRGDQPGPHGDPRDLSRTMWNLDGNPMPTGMTIVGGTGH